MAVLVLVAFLLGNLVHNLTAAGLLLSWRWLGNPAGFDISETLLPYDASLPYWRALLAGLANTLRVVLAGLVGATVLGTLVGTASFSSNGLLRRLARVYVELIRNIPLLLQLVFWYFVVFLALPNGRDALQLPGVVLARSGLYLGWFTDPLHLTWAGPHLEGGQWHAPLRLTVEFGALLTGLVVYTAAFIAEVVRGGLQAVPSGQVEAAASLGLSWWQTLRHVVLPQALTAVLPGLVNNFIAIFKDTSLVTIVSLYELTGALGLALNSDADWRPFKLEGYVFIALIYFLFCFSISRYSLWVERQLALGNPS